MNRLILALSAGAFLACILGANYATSNLSMVPVGFGLVATAGTYFAGATFILRDTVQDLGGKRFVVALIFTGAGLSYLVADPFIALASGVAFLLAEASDFALYTPLRRRGYVRAALVSNVAGAFVDTIAFLWIAGLPVVDSLAGQMVGKLWLTAAVVLTVGGARALLRQPVHAESA